MIDTSRQFDESAMRILSSCRGHTLVSYEAYSPFGDAHHLYKTVRLHFDGFSLDLRNVHEPLVIGPDYAEEQFAILAIDHADDRPLWRPSGRELVAEPVGFPIRDILTLTDTLVLSKGSRRLVRLKLTQSVLFEDGEGTLLAFDRDAWPDEYLTVREGDKVSAVTRDFRKDFAAEPPFEYLFGRDVHRLSSMRASRKKARP